MNKKEEIKNESNKITDHRYKIIGNETAYLQNIQLQSYDDDNCNFCKFISSAYF